MVVAVNDVVREARVIRHLHEHRLEHASRGRAAAARGVDIIENCAVTGIRRAPDGRVCGVETARGYIGAQKIAISAAAHSSVLMDMAGLRVPMECFPLQALGLAREGGEPLELSCDFLFVDRDREDETAQPSYHRFWSKSRSLQDKSTFGVLVLKD